MLPLNEIERVIRMKDKQTILEGLANEIIKFFADNAISYNEAGEIMFYVKKKMGEQLVRDH